MKVHFADLNCFVNANVLIDMGVKYTLQTFHQINKAKGKLAHDYELLNQFNHIIIDSGLFSIMFGCDKDKLFNKEICEKWYSDYIIFINKTEFKNASFVECDVQKKLGADYAWELRKRMKVDLPRKRIINVYHLEDENPDRLIEFSNYIAISIPELRFNLSRKESLKIIRYISTKAMSKRKLIHLLGCTEKKLLKEFSYCYSCDSTSWNAPARYGFLKTEFLPTIRIKKAAELCGMKYKTDRENQANCSRIILEEYKLYAGDQS